MYKNSTVFRMFIISLAATAAMICVLAIGGLTFDKANSEPEDLAKVSSYSADVPTE
ncbi:MAG: hypothetical protein IJ129_05835 [Ruminococcus sp.]|nr:hypothetical protein [Ruminococcus sp.]